MTKLKQKMEHSKNEAKQSEQIIVVMPRQLKSDFQTTCRAGGLSMSAAIKYFVTAVTAGKIIFRSGIKFKDKQ